MGGEGSGRYRRRGAKRTIEEVPALDVRAWAREGLLVEGQWFAARMVGDGRFPLTVEVERDAVRITKNAGGAARPRWNGRPNPAGAHASTLRRIALVVPLPEVRLWTTCSPRIRRRTRVRMSAVPWPGLRVAAREQALPGAEDGAEDPGSTGGQRQHHQPYPVEARGMHRQTYLRQIRRMFEAEQEFWAAGKLGGNGPGKIRDDAEYGWP